MYACVRITITSPLACGRVDSARSGTFVSARRSTRRLLLLFPRPALGLFVVRSRCGNGAAFVARTEAAFPLRFCGRWYTSQLAIPAELIWSRCWSLFFSRVPETLLQCGRASFVESDREQCLWKVFGTCQKLARHRKYKNKFTPRVRSKCFVPESWPRQFVF